MQSTQNQVTDPVTPAVTLQCAAIYLERFGWSRDDYYDQSVEVFTPPACLVGAISMVCYGFASHRPHLRDRHDYQEYLEFAAALTALQDHVLSTGFDEGVYVFNDAACFTAATAVSVLKDAAASWSVGRGGAA